MPGVLRALASTENSIEKWWQQLEAARKHPEGSGKVINALAMGGPCLVGGAAARRGLGGLA
jgi:hypothetical protein